MGVSHLNKAIFLDRDGVLNNAIIRDHLPYPPRELEELVIPKGVQSALNELKSAGFLLIGATNQPDAVRGKTTQESIILINNALMTQLPLDEIRVCYHDDSDHCHCRKPLPGLLLDAAKEYDIDLTQSYMIGDRWRDIEAGKNAGCKTIWLRHDYHEKQPPRSPDWVTTSLTKAADWIIKQTVSLRIKKENKDEFNDS